MSGNNVFQFRWTVLNVSPGMNNNNNNRVPLVNIRDRLFRVIFVRLAVSYAGLVPDVIREVIEKLLLLLSITSLLTLIYIHVMFIHTHLDCLDPIQGDWPRDGILRVEVHHNHRGRPYTLSDSYKRENIIRRCEVPNFPYHKILERTQTKTPYDEATSSSTDTDSKSLVPEQGADAKELTEDEIADMLQKKIDSSPTTTTESDELPEVELRVAVFPPNKTKAKDNEKSGSDEEICTDYLQNSYIVEYSMEYGFLKMSEKARRKLNLPVKLVVLDSCTDKCFGNCFTRLFLEYVLGYNEALLASVSKLAANEGSKGFIRNVVQDHYFRFVNVLSHTSYIFAAVVMFIFTFSISTLLRYAHHQIFIFIVQVLRMFEFRAVGNIPTAPLLTVVLSLVGMEAIMSEFFTSPTTSFYIILIVWAADQYDAICCRTTITRRHWLRFFYLYHFGFYGYEYRFSGQYSDFALFTSFCFILHSMVYFFHRYELPVILRFAGRRVIHRPPQMHSPPRDSDPPGDGASAESPNEEDSSSSSHGAASYSGSGSGRNADGASSTSDGSPSPNLDVSFDEDNSTTFYVEPWDETESNPQHGERQDQNDGSGSNNPPSSTTPPNGSLPQGSRILVDVSGGPSDDGSHSVFRQSATSDQEERRRTAITSYFSRFPYNIRSLSVSFFRVQPLRRQGEPPNDGDAASAAYDERIRDHLPGSSWRSRYVTQFTIGLLL